MSGGSVYNLYTDEDEEAEPSPSGQQIIENSITMNKMKLLKAKMENMNLSKKPKKVVKVKPRPPIAPRPSSSSTAAARHRLLRVLPQIGQSCLPSGNVYLPETSRNAGTSPAAQAPADRPVSSLRNEMLKDDDNWEINMLSHSTSSIRLLPQLAHLELENDKELADSVLHFGSSLPRRTKHLSGNLSSNHEDDVVLFPRSEECVADELLLPEVGAFAPFAEGNGAEQSSGMEGLGKVTPEFPLTKGDGGLRPAEQPLSHVARVLSCDPGDSAVFNHREPSSHKNRLLSPLLCAAPVSLHNSLVKPQRQSKCFESGNHSASTSQNTLRELDIRTIADSSFSRTARFRGVKVDSPGKRSDIISKVEARDITEMANKASKEPVGCVNNSGFLASLARSASRDSLQGTRGAGRLRSSGIGLSTSFQHFQDENIRKSSPQSEPTDFFLSARGIGMSGSNAAAGKRTDVETTSVHLIAMQKLMAALMTTKVQGGGTCRKQTLWSTHQNFPKSNSSLRFTALPEESIILTEKYCLDCIIFVRLQKICQITSAHNVHCCRLKMPTVLMSLFLGESQVLKVVLKSLHYNDLVLLLHVCVKYFIFEIGIIY
ncbi:AN1-type zinc finger protein 4 isoform X8 [Arvicanthis niloticus]|uniref:AN1-type zinc finger protein 4 isoform X8 n=1 Tax=Arvicanthis niloticus TaxID=61156 RepID=UPI00402BAEA3